MRIIDFCHSDCWSSKSPKTVTTLEPQNPDDKTLEEASGSSGYYRCTEDCKRASSDSKVQVLEKHQGASMNGDGMNISNNNSVNVGCVVRNFWVNDGTNRENEEENNASNSHGVDSTRTIEVSGNNKSQIVDSSSSLGEMNGDHPLEANGNSQMANLSKENEVSDQFANFSVGDFVWVLIGTHNWWPGKVIDLKADQKESLMVSYFGQNRVASCSWSQLKLFHLNFETMLKQNKSRSFFGAVEKAMADFGESLKLEMTCSCIPKENGKGKIKKLKSSLADEFSLESLEPVDFLARLKILAIAGSMLGMLELTVIHSHLSAFYSSIGHKQMPLNQLYENSQDQSSRPTKEKPRKRIKERSNSQKRVREKVSKILGVEDEVNDLVNIPKMETDVPNIGTRDDGNALRGRKKSKYLSYPYVNSNEAAKDEKVPESSDLFFGSPSVILGSTKKFQKDWFNKFISDENNTSAKVQLVNSSTVDLLSELRLLAIDCESPKETGNFFLTKWLISKFRIFVYHDMHCNNAIGEKDSTSAEGANTDLEQNMPKRRKNFVKSKMKSLSCLSDVNVDSATNSSCVKVSRPIIFPQTPGEKSCLVDIPDKPANTIPDLNVGNAMLSFTGLDHPKSASISGVPDMNRESRSVMINFEVISPCSINSIPSLGFTFDLPGLNGNPLTFDLNSGLKKKRRRRNGAEEPQKTKLVGFIPDLNGTYTETLLAPPVKPKQHRRRLKKEVMINEEAKGTTTLRLKFASETSMPSKDDLASTFSGFGPLNASETQLLKEPGGAQVAFMSGADAVEAVKSLEKNKPFGETLISFKLQQKPAAVNLNLAPKIPSVKPVGPIPKPGEVPTSVEFMRRNLVMMTSMLDKAGDSLSQEMRVKLESEIKGLLEKVGSIPSSSSS